MTVRKPVVYIYGNCQAINIFNLARLIPGFTEDYIVAIHHDNGYFNSSEPIPIGEALTTCAFFIEQRSRLPSPFDKDSLLAPDCKRASYPFLTCELLWPLYIDNKQPYPFNNPGNWRSNGDRFLSALQSRSDLTPEKILERYLNIDITSKIDLDRHHDFYFEQVADLDTHTDVKAAPIIAANFRQRHLFYDTKHPTPPIMITMAKSMFQYFGLPFPFNVREDPENFSITLPIHPQVREHYHLEWVNPHSRFGFHSPNAHETNIYLHGERKKDGDYDFVSFIAKHIGLIDALAVGPEPDLPDRVKRLQDVLTISEGIRPPPPMDRAIIHFQDRIRTTIAQCYLRMGVGELGEELLTEVTFRNPEYYPALLELITYLSSKGKTRTLLPIVKRYLATDSLKHCSQTEMRTLRILLDSLCLTTSSPE
ncbi:MAG: hypothetical protein HQL57_01700 [Magnetococcales bacterium]|nr:hypothetical protein [Magnetococcales bacterium]MBF0155884.1 hypothetical protein [Magnetococcales bacterium]